MTFLGEIHRVASQLRDATSETGEKVFADVYMGAMPQHMVKQFPCAIIEAVYADELRITALYPFTDVLDMEARMITVAEGACFALGRKRLGGHFDWMLQDDQVYRTWTLYEYV